METSETSDKLYELLNSLKKMKGEPVAFQTTNLRRLGKILQALSNKTPAPFKVFYKKATNMVGSLADGYASDDATEKDLEALIEEVRNLWGSCKNFEHNKKEPEPKEGEDKEHPTNPDKRTEELKKQGREALHKYEFYRNLIVGALQGKRFKATRAPVIAITKNMLLSDKLQKMKMSTGSFEGYPVLDNQVVIGIDMDWINTEFKHQVKPAVEQITLQVEEKTGKRYHWLGGSRKVGTVLWVWLVSDGDIKRLNACSLGNHLIVKSWTFPFKGFK